MMELGFTFDGKHSYRDFGITMPDYPIIGFPKKIKVKERLTGTNIVYDFSQINGVQMYEDRPITIPVNMLNFNAIDYNSTQLFATEIYNWLMGPSGRRELIFDHFPEFVFMAEVENADDLEVNVHGFADADIHFIAYFAKIRDKYTDDDDWDNFVFDVDIANDTRTTLKPITEQLPFKTLKIGDSVNLGGWSQLSSSAGAINQYHTAQNYTISNIRNDLEADFSVHRYDGTEYFLSEIGIWVLAQDIVQCRETQEIILHSKSVEKIIPEIEILGSGGFNGITIEKDGRFYNYRKTQSNKRLSIDPPETILKVYGQSYEVNVRWREEMI